MKMKMKKPRLGRYPMGPTNTLVGGVNPEPEAEICLLFKKVLFKFGHRLIRLDALVD